MITRIRIQGYKSLRDLVVELKPLSVVFGPNAAGKSNFLDALQLLSRLATAKSLKDAFAPPYRGKPLESFSFGPGGVESALKQDSLLFSIEADMRLSDVTVTAIEHKIAELKRSTPESSAAKPTRKMIGDRLLRYRIAIQIRPQSGILQVVDEFAAALNSKGEIDKSRKPFIEAMTSNDQKRLHRRLEGQSHPTYFDLGMDHSVLSEPIYEPHFPHLAALKHELESWQFYYLEPRERMRSSVPVKETQQIGQMGEDLGVNA